MIFWFRNNFVASICLTIVRVTIGILFLIPGLSKLLKSVWIGDQAGIALTKFIQNALLLSKGSHAEVSSWFASFLEHVVLPHATLFSYIIAWGEVLTGTALILGFFTAFSTFMGFVMSFSYLLAGTSNINPQMLVGEMLILFSGYNAAKIGLDYWLAPYWNQLKTNLFKVKT